MAFRMENYSEFLYLSRRQFYFAKRRHRGDILRLISFTSDMKMLLPRRQIRAFSI